MRIEDEGIRRAVENTFVLHPPSQQLDTFGITSIRYYLLSEPTYQGALDSDEYEDKKEETVIREGKVIAQRPRVVTPNYMYNLEGFSENARKYYEDILRSSEANAPGLLYAYKNEQGSLNVVPGKAEAVADKIKRELKQKEEQRTTIIKGEDGYWDVSLLKFIYELTAFSFHDNVMQLGQRGLLGMDASGIPTDARLKIEEMFSGVYSGKNTKDELKDELERWGLFEEYQDRFFRLLRG